MGSPVCGRRPLSFPAGNAKKVARPEGFEPPTLCSGAQRLKIPSALSSVACGRVHSRICPKLGYKGYNVTS
jgi:hypothetical protein